MNLIIVLLSMLLIPEWVKVFGWMILLDLEYAKVLRYMEMSENFWECLGLLVHLFLVLHDTLQGEN